MPDTRLNVFQMLSLRRNHHVPAARHTQRLKFLGLDDVAHEAANLAVQEPKLTIRLRRRIYKDGHELTL